MRSVSSVALQLLRAIDETLMKGATHNLIVRTRSDVAIYVLNNKRAHLRRLEERFKVTITITTDPTMTGQPAYAIDRGEQVMSVEQAKALAAQFESEMPRAARAGTASRTRSTKPTRCRPRRNPNMANARNVGERPGRTRGAADGAAVDAAGNASKERRAIRDAGRAIRNSRPLSPTTRRPKAADVEGVEDHGEQDDGAPMQAGAPREGGGRRMATASAAAADGAADAATGGTAKAMATWRRALRSPARNPTSATAPTTCHRRCHRQVIKPRHQHRPRRARM